VFAIPAQETTLPGLLAQRTPRDSEVVAYYCSGTQCHAPITELDDLSPYLGSDSIDLTVS